MITLTEELIQKLGIKEIVLDDAGKITGLKGHFRPKTYRTMSNAIEKGGLND